jgi:isoquinoline 1-oxidoreductase beta subunit
VPLAGIIVWLYPWRMKRRSWLLTSGALAAGLLVGWTALPPRSRLGTTGQALDAVGKETVNLNGWISIRADGRIALAMPRSEMGQGVFTGFATLAAEELDVALDQINLETAGPDSLYGNVAMFAASLPFHPSESSANPPPFKVKAADWVVRKLVRELGVSVTGGSSSMADAWAVVPLAAATARARLLAAAAQTWQVPVTELVTQNGRVLHAPSGRSASYADLAPQAAKVSVGDVQLKPRDQWQLIGKTGTRVDTTAKVNGTAVFGLDVRPVDLDKTSEKAPEKTPVLASEKWLFAVAAMAPQFGGRLAEAEASTALALPGVVRWVKLPAKAGSTEGFAVVAQNTWQAMQGVKAMKANWLAPELDASMGPVDSDQAMKALQSAVQTDQGFVFYEHGDALSAEAKAKPDLQAQYTAPYLAHQTLEPMNCTVQSANGRLKIWAPTQVPSFVLDAAAKSAGVPADHVDLQVTLLGGGFGRRLELDFVLQAVEVARACSPQPVQLMWPREQDTRHDFYRPAGAAQFKAWLTPDGQVSGLSVVSAGDAITPRWLARVMPLMAGPVDMPDKTTAEGLFDLPYGIPRQVMRHVATRARIPIGFWRSVGHSHNAFFSESFINELADLAHQDPIAFRLQLLAHEPRHKAVLAMAAEKSNWGQPLPPGFARGVALHESFGTVVAQVVEASFQGRTLKIHRVVCAVDCGTVINPLVVAQQMEGAVVFALSAALYGEIDVKNAEVQQGNFNDAPVVRMAESPLVQTFCVDSHASPTGVGEPGVPPLAPALAAALFALDGQRRRSLPLKWA